MRKSDKDELALLLEKLKWLRLPGMARMAAELFAEAAKKNLSPLEVTHRLADEEKKSRIEGAIKRRLRDAHFPEVNTVDGFDFDFDACRKKLKARYLALHDLSFVGRGINPLFIGHPGTNKYDSLQTSLQRRFANGVQVNVAYTWSKAIGICCNDLADNPPAIQALNYFALNRSILPFDRRHNFQAAFVAELPFGRGKRFANGGGVASALAGGWQVNGLFSYYSGQPFSISASGTSLNIVTGSTQRADQVKPNVQIFGATGPGQLYFDKTAFAPVTDARFGTAGFNTMVGPDVRNFDFSLFRQFRITEKINMQFRGEIFNLTNTPHFSNPNGSVDSSAFATVTGIKNIGREGLDERVFRFGLRFAF